tara:strand:- start:1542 stop:2534 length:993 start_codon:yes stop_codon:yes gene_type:complete
MLDLSNKKILVTGAAGFIGSHLCSQMLDMGFDVTAVTHYNSTSSNGNLDFLDPKKKDKLKIIKGNVEDPYFIDNSLKGIDIVFHLAALIGIPYSYVAPMSYVKTNIEGTLNILESCKKNNIKMIHTSTSENYGTAMYTPIDEKHPLQGQSPYSASKISADKIVESYYNSFDMDVVTIRPFNVFGPRQSARAIIPTIISQLIKSNTIEIGSVKPIRDFTYVEDTVMGFIKAAQHENISGKIINIGNGQGISIKELIDLCSKKLNIENINILNKDNRNRPQKSEVFNLICNNQYAKETISWEPKISLSIGLDTTIDFIRNNINFYNVGKYEI